MKEFNLLKEEHGIRARLKELNSSDERRIDTGFIFIVILLITVAVLSYAVYSISNLGVTARTDSRIPDLKSLKLEVPAPDFQKPDFKPENLPSPPLTKEEDEGKFANETVVNEGVGEVISAVSQQHKNEKRFSIRVAVCILKESADAVQRDLKDKGFSSYVKSAQGTVKGKATNLYKVYAGDYNSREKASAAADKLKAKGVPTIIEEIKNGKG